MTEALAPKQRRATRKDSNAPAAPYSLPALLTIDTATELAASLEARMPATNGSLVLEAAGVEQAFTPGIQLLLALQKSLARSGGTLHLNAPSKPLINACRDAGIISLIPAEGASHG